jgi:hypothetical protein
MKGAKKTVRVGAGLGFYGDSWRPVRASIERGGVRYIASDHLSELTLAILQKDRQKDASAGYARDGLPMLLELWPLAAKHGVKFILNAGGLNPDGARQAIAKAFLRRLRRAGHTLRQSFYFVAKTNTMTNTITWSQYTKFNQFVDAA